MVIDVKNLSFAYKGENIYKFRGKTINDITFSVKKGEIVAIVGLSGSGKSTLCQIISGMIPHCYDGKMDGKIEVLGIEPWREELAEYSCRVGHVMQDSDAQLICGSVEKEIAFSLENICCPQEKIRSRVDYIMDAMGITELKHRNPRELSAGEKKLVCIGAVLAMAPEIIVFDEPMGQLDRQGRETVQRVIGELKAQGRTVILTEHNLEWLDMADRIMILREGRIVDFDSAEKLIDIIESLWR